MGGMVSGIMSASNLTFFGFFYHFFTPFLMRSPCSCTGLELTFCFVYSSLYTIRAVGLESFMIYRIGVVDRFVTGCLRSHPLNLIQIMLAQGT
jgi:hypothetical protein